MLVWSPSAKKQYEAIRGAALNARRTRKAKGKAKSSKQEGLFKQVAKTLHLLSADPKHPSLQTHPYSKLPNPYNAKEKVFEAYVQQQTPGAYRLFWCYGPKRNNITIIAITPHP